MGWLVGWLGGWLVGCRSRGSVVWNGRRGRYEGKVGSKRAGGAAARASLLIGLITVITESFSRAGSE